MPISSRIYMAQPLPPAIKRSRKPILYVGGGAINSGAANELLKFARKTKIPVTMTLMGISTFVVGLLPGYGTLGIVALVLAIVPVGLQLIGLILGIVALIAIVWGGKTVLYNRKHATTDNAQVDGTIVPVLAKVGGYVASVRVVENQAAKQKRTKEAVLEELKPRLAKRGIDPARMALFGIDEDRGGATYLIWRPDGTEPMVTAFYGGGFDIFASLGRYLEFLIGERVHDDSGNADTVKSRLASRPFMNLIRGANPQFPLPNFWPEHR
mgnify:CR=1 FL=1